MSIAAAVPIITGLIDAGVGIHGAVQGTRRDEQNFNLQQQNLDWQRWAQKETWSREDNAVQRRMADLRSAGLNPILAAGSAASTSSPMQTQAPQRETSAGEEAAKAASAINGMALALITQQLDITRTNAQAELLRAQAENTKQDWMFKKSTFDTRAQTEAYETGIKAKEQALMSQKAYIAAQTQPQLIDRERYITDREYYRSQNEMYKSHINFNTWEDTVARIRQQLRNEEHIGKRTALESALKEVELEFQKGSGLSPGAQRLLDTLLRFIPGFGK